MSAGQQPSGRAIGIAMAIGVIIGSGGGVMLEASAASAVIILAVCAAISVFINGFHRPVDVSEPLAENADTVAHAPVLISTGHPRS